jgi:hypothetical protein
LISVAGAYESVGLREDVHGSRNIERLHARKDCYCDGSHDQCLKSEKTRPLSTAGTRGRRRRAIGSVGRVLSIAVKDASTQTEFNEALFVQPSGEPHMNPQTDTPAFQPTPQFAEVSDDRHNRLLDQALEATFPASDPISPSVFY